MRTRSRRSVTSTQLRTLRARWLPRTQRGRIWTFASYTATDPDGDSVSLSLMGDDAGLFELAADMDTGDGANRMLSFKESPDFEMPGDRNQDNVYEVTVRASDGTLTEDRMVAVKVTNVDEDGKW